MPKEIAVVHHADRRRDVMMPYAPGIVVRRGNLVFLSGVTAAPVYHHHPHRPEEFDTMPRDMEGQARAALDNLKRSLAAGVVQLEINDFNMRVDFLRREGTKNFGDRDVVG